MSLNCHGLLSVPAAAANQHLNQQAQVGAAGAPHGPPGQPTPNHHSAVAAAAAAGRHSNGAAGSSGGAGGVAGNSTRSKSRRTAPSVNSGSTGPPVGSKRGHEVGSDEAAPAAKKVCLQMLPCLPGMALRDDCSQHRA